MLIIKQC